MSASSLLKVAAALRRGETTSVEITRAALARADALDATLGVYLSRLSEQAVAQAARADAELHEGVDRGPLHGIPIGIKDIIATADIDTTAQSAAADPAWARGRDAPVVSALRRGGAILTGKVSLSEFAIGDPDPSKPFPIPRNPWAFDRWAGGSSSGSASGVAARFFFAALGTDTGGSIRIPAALCGVSGFKPSYGLLPTEGCVPVAFTLDHVGPIAPTVADCGAVLDVLLQRPHLTGRAGGRIGEDLAGLRIGVVRPSAVAGRVEAEVEQAFDAAIGHLDAMGAIIREVSLPLYDAGRAAIFVILQSEALAYHRNRLQARWSEYFATTRRILAMGALGSGADYVQAQRVREHVRLRLRDLFAEVDIVAMPTVTVGAPSFDAHGGVDVRALRRHVHTAYWNCAGNPTLALPIGFDASGLPLSLQLAGPPFEDELVLRVGSALQQVSDWHERCPAGPKERVITVAPGGATQQRDVSSEALVAVLCSAAGLPAGYEDRVEIARAYAARQSSVEILHALDVGDSPMAIRFEPDRW